MASRTKTDSRAKEGAEPITVQEGNSRGILLLHGFGDTPQTLRLLAGHLHVAGYDIRAPLLPGHGTTVADFTESRRRDWLACAREELTSMRRSHAVVSIAGLSMGGALASIVAAENPWIGSLVLISPYMNMPIPHRIASASHWIWGPIAGVRKGNSPRSILDPRERAMNLGYGVYSGRLLYELWRLAAQARRALPEISVPTLLLQSKADPRIAPSIAEATFAALGTRDKKLVWVEGGGHIITVDYGRETVFAEVIDWLRKHNS